MKRRRRPTVRANSSGEASNGPPPASGSTSSTFLSFRPSSARLRALSGSFMQMLGKAAAAMTIPLKRRRDDVEDGQDLPASKRRDRAAILHAASSEVVRRSTADSRRAGVVAQQEGFMIPGGWDLVGISGSPFTTPIYPPPLSVRASMETSSAPQSASISGPVPHASTSKIVPPSVSTDGFRKAMDDLNARLVEGRRVSADIKAAVEKFRVASTSTSAPASRSSSQGHLPRGSSGTGAIRPSFPNRQIIIGHKKRASVSLTRASRAAAITAAMAVDNASSSVSINVPSLPPSISNSDFQASMNDLNARLVGPRPSSLKIQDAVERFRATSISASQAQVPLNTSVAPTRSTERSNYIRQGTISKTKRASASVVRSSRHAPAVSGRRTTAPAALEGVVRQRGVTRKV
ncbi:hypothetical protein A4X13_0g331 [Tilletia indica]|uniref:Uncharacterized protein n=1 Tax=Tilletia indica TaxID=43049 RepID=A0A177TRF5_9BASI|nr:hypothetical protein A4X13_0g331 [Tilletia indica]